MDTLEILTRAFVVIACLPVHECAHAWTADMLGDPTGRLQGRISLNPKRHLDLWGTVMILLMGIGFAKPVPVNPSNFKNPKKGMAITAAAGPASNLLMALVLMILTRIVRSLAPYAVIQFLLIAAYINISLAVFNLIPVPPLDGSKVFAVVLPNHLYNRYLRIERYSVLVLWGLLYLLGNLGISPIGYLAGGIFDFLLRVLF